MILNNLKFGDHNLSDPEIDKVKRAVLDICGPVTKPYFSPFDER